MYIVLPWYSPLIPPLRDASAFSLWLCARYLVIILDTVIGVPEQDRVNISPKTDRATWNKPKPSVPIVRERKILYKKPKNFSLMENTVTIATVLKKFLMRLAPKNLSNLFYSTFFANIIAL